MKKVLAEGSFLHDLGEGILFSFEVLKRMGSLLSLREEISTQILNVFWQSLITTAFAGFFVGAIMTLQFALQVQVFDALPFLGGLVTSGTIREVGPLLIAFLLSGKIGAFTSAELGTMQVTEQIDAIRCLGADPIREIIFPRFIGIILASFLLLSLGLMMSFGGGILVAWLFTGLPWEQYIKHIPTVMTYRSALAGFFKCFLFSSAIAAVCTYRGYSVFGGAKEVGYGVVSAATQTMVALVLLDWASSFVLERVINAF